MTALAATASAPAAGRSGSKPQTEAQSFNPDARLERIYTAIRQGKLNDALLETDRLIAEQPNFQLAYLIRGDLLMAKAGPLRGIGGGVRTQSETLQDLREEAVVRLRSLHLKLAPDKVPRYLLQLRPDQKTAVVVDVRRSRLYVYENVDGQPRFMADYYVTQGKFGAGKATEGDQKTPIGVYHVTATLPGPKLPDFYGPGALPINYPNEWDQINGRTGSGIWFHGTSREIYSRAPRASDGCVVLSNRDLKALFRVVKAGVTPVVIADDVEWLSLDDWHRERQSLMRTIETWRQDWESLDVQRYLAHYSTAFESNSVTREQWAQRKADLGVRKTWAKVRLDQISMLRYPGKDDMVVVTFRQDYRSSNSNLHTKKRQYWRREGARWKIIYEGTT